jgi:hypothetical protein
LVLRAVVAALLGIAVVPSFAHAYDGPTIAAAGMYAIGGAQAAKPQLSDLREGSAAAVSEARDAPATGRPAFVATSTAIGFTDDAVGTAYQGMRSGGGHAMRHLMDEGLIPNSGSLASRAGLFEDLTSPILTNPAKTFDWKLGNTATRAFAGQAGGKQVVVFVAKEGPYQGKVLSAVVPDAGQMTQWGL